MGRDGTPAFLALDFSITEKLLGASMQENGVIMDTVLSQNDLKLRPDGTVTSFIFSFATGMNAHYESFSDHDKLPLGCALKGKNAVAGADLGMGFTMRSVLMVIFWNCF